jgi:endonuclease YncB( thermonuclease family)
MLSASMPSLRHATLLLALALVGCPHQAPHEDAAETPHFDAGPIDPSFDGTPAFDDDATTAIDPATLATSTSACRAPLLARVTRAVDGDTLHVDGISESTGDLTIRIIGVDAPEIAHGAGTVADCYGDEATTFTTQLVGHVVWLTFDPDCLDMYGRTLAYVIYGAAPSQMWERQMLRRGFARTLAIAPNTTHRALFTDDEAVAQIEHAGLWSACP